MNDRTKNKSGQDQKSITQAGQEFLVQLLRHFQNDRPDVSELELDEDR